MTRKVFLGLQFQAVFGELTDKGDVVNQQTATRVVPTLDEAEWLQVLAELRAHRDGADARPQE